MAAAAAADELFNLLADQKWDKLNEAIDKATQRQLFYRGNSGDGLLDKACFYNLPPPIFAKLLDKGLDSNDTREDGCTPVYTAAENNVHPKLMELLLEKGGDPNKPKEDGSTPVFVAAQNNVNPKLMELLLTHGGDPNKAENNHNMTPVYIAARQNINPKSMELLLNAGGDANKPANDGATPVHFAAENNVHPNLMELLLNAGGDPNKPRDDGATPVFIAAFNNVHPRLMELLMERGGDPNKAQNNGVTPVYIAAQQSINPKSMELLLNAGGDANIPKEDGATPVYIIAQNNGNPKLMELLLEHGGGDPNKPLENGVTPVHIAARRNVNPKLMELLLEKGGDPNKAENEGWTAFHAAASEGASVELVKLMLDFGANPRLSNKGRTPLSFAQSKGHSHLVQLLKNPPPQTRWPTGVKPDMDSVTTATRAMRIAQSKADEHLLFFSYAQADCAAEVMHLADKAKNKFKGASIFRDADVRFKLDELVEHVKRSKNVIVLLSDLYAKRPFTLVELHTALKSGMNVVAVKVTRPGLKSFDFVQVADDIASGKLVDYLDAKGWALLGAYGIGVDAVANDLKTVMNVKAFDLNASFAARVLAAMVEEVFEGVVVG